MSFLNNQERTIDGINTFNADVIDIVEDIEVGGDPGDAYNVLQKSATNALQWGPLHLPTEITVTTLTATNLSGAVLNNLFDHYFGTGATRTINLLTINCDGTITTDGHLSVNSTEEISNIKGKVEIENDLTIKGRGGSAYDIIVNNAGNTAPLFHFDGSADTLLIHNLGVHENRVVTLFVSTATISSLAASQISTSTISGFEVTGNIVPPSNNTLALGDPSLNFANSYVTHTHTDDIDCNTHIEVPSITCNLITGHAVSGNITFSNADLHIGSSSGNSVGKIWVDNISAHAQTGNITMSGTHDIGTDPARAGTIYSTTLNTTNLHATHFTPANIGAFAMTGNITCASSALTIGLIGNPLSNIKALDMTISNKLVVSSLSSFQLDGTLTFNSPHDIGEALSKAGTIYATDLGTTAVPFTNIHATTIGAQTHPITNINATNIHTYFNFIAHHSDHTNGLVQFDTTANKSYFWNNAGNHPIIEVDAGAELITFKNKDGVRVMDMDMSNDGLIRIFSTHTDHTTTPLLTINNGLEFGNAGLFTWGHDSLHQVASSTSAGEMYIDSGFLKVNTTGWTPP